MRKGHLGNIKNLSMDDIHTMYINCKTIIMQPVFHCLFITSTI